MKKESIKPENQEKAVLVPVAPIPELNTTPSKQSPSKSEKQDDFSAVRKKEKWYFENMQRPGLLKEGFLVNCEWIDSWLNFLFHEYLFNEYGKIGE